MLTDATKRKINNCRDTLVGKIPVPMSQIEQITLAMTYKFMSDIDTENSALGGTSFFEWEYAKYAWKNLMDKRNGAQERLNLYSEGLDSMSRNPHIPELFRDIFRNAYLPFKDPTTLDRFLKQIDEFHYGHSEELGNAFEYLLSTAGSQGDAGQFRTPRHIIDFLVAVVDPSRDDRILDPACGTAGFLISAYKHIIEQGGSSLTIEDKQDITRNIVGYDISHDMVRLSLVNMYLHHFADPRIYEYDTLSMETRWNEEYSCILANPPFMTPKWGIEPHKRFSIRATKAEVLFTDYIMEHLSIHGKAGIIVPEGVIFQSGNAYKDLRKKMIMDNYLYAVVSLPSGIFQPYSGVKTSILFFDRQIAKKTDNILFVKVANDGYDLGAQRREIGKNDLPKALEILKQYKNDIDLSLDTANWGELAHLVKKSKIAESGDYKLSGDLYKVSTNITNSDYKVVELGDYIDTITPPKKIQKSEFLDKWLIPVIDQSQEFLSWYTNDNESRIIPNKPLVIFGDHTCIVKYIDFPFAQWADWIKVIDTKEELLPKFLYYNLLYRPLESDGYQRHFTKLKLYKIPLPPLEIQEQIVAELDGYQRIIDGARQVVENYKPTIKIDPEWKMVELGEVCELQGWWTPSRENNEFWNGDIPWITSKYFSDDWKITGSEWITKKWLNESSAKIVPKNAVILITRVSVWKFAFADKDYAINQDLTGLIPWDKLIPKFLFYSCTDIANTVKRNAVWIWVTWVTRDFVKKIHIPLPSLEIQEQIVARIEAEQRLVDATKELIAIYEGKVKERIEEVWGL